MDTAQAQQVAQMAAQHWFTPGTVLIIIGGLWTVTTGIAVALYRLMRDAFAKNDASHTRIFLMIDGHKQALADAHVAAEQRCETRMGAHGERIGGLEVDVGQLKVKNDVRRELRDKGGTG
jgi:hypothetical protein